MKKNTFSLDIDFEEESPLLGNIAVLFFHTDTPSYLLVDDLNHLYRLSLSRLDDLSLFDAQWPFYSYHDQLRLLHYYLIDLSAASTFCSPARGELSAGLRRGSLQFSKLLILRGEDTDAVADALLRDFNTPPPSADPLNPHQLRRNDILLSYQQQLTSVTRYHPQPPAPLPRKAAKERQELDTLLTAILDYIDIHHH